MQCLHMHEHTPTHTQMDLNDLLMFTKAEKINRKVLVTVEQRQLEVCLCVFSLFLSLTTHTHTHGCLFRLH